MMTSDYQPEDYLPISGIQHFFFCRRQWALIHVERQWQENVLTVEGKLLHNRADDPFFSEVRDGVIIARAMPVTSYRLGLHGVCDVVEFYPCAEGVRIPGRQGTYRPAVVEYKRGREKSNPCDEAQVCAQTICLEEMLSIEIPEGYLFYGEPRRRTEVHMTPDLRQQVAKICAEMHSYFQRGYTPRVKPTKACKSCSLADICLPELQAGVLPASQYIQRHIDEP